MEVSSWMLGALLGSALLVVIESAPASDLYDVDPRQLAEIWARERVSPPSLHSLRHTELQQQLRSLAREFPSVVHLEKAGNSTEGREITLLSLGAGSKSILLWSQMHGDETTGTSALLDLAQFLGRHRQELWVREMLGKYTLLCVPMLNPDGAERNQRRNAQGLDINRDARALQTPEGRLLKNIRDRYQPFLGFNLHNQNSLTTVGDTGKVATIALLAVASEPTMSSIPELASNTPPPGGSGLNHLSKQITAVLYDALSPFIYGHVSRYDENYNARAFGDNLTHWGTPVVLLENGGNPAGQAGDLGIQLDFVGLVAVLNSLSAGKIQNANPAVFDSLKMNSDAPIFDLLLRNAWIFSGTGVPLFRGDVAIRHDLRADAREDALIADLGDLGVFTAHETIDCTGLMLTPGLIAWDPRKSLLETDAPLDTYLEKGFLTVLETVPGGDIGRKRPAPEHWRTTVRPANWGYVVAGELRKGKADGFSLAEWLAAGGHGWIRDAIESRIPDELDNIPGWFGIEAMSSVEAARFRFPTVLDGEPSKALVQWTSGAARRFQLPGRGVIALGAVADLVLWKTPTADPPTDLRQCTPVRVIVNGHPMEPSAPELHGRFLGRQHQ